MESARHQPSLIEQARNVARMENDQMSTHGQRTPIVVTHDGGVKFSAQLRTHRVIVDQPIRGGGDDAGPSPVEMLGVMERRYRSSLQARRSFRLAHDRER